MTLLRTPATMVWVALMTATCISTWMLSEHTVAPALTTIGIFLIASTKIHLVMRHFMELRTGPRVVQALFAGWILVATAVILGSYLATP